ncbi:acyl-CoA carboxylase subunit epsilon [Micromonospora sp. NPDC049366]|uniref:acyl-CoA carboxylase subunit epsilon n=1 Tax=Micromonospora sp. NPDC049366 TaxID=3364271 RepID=UPI0037AD9B2E
MSAEEPLFRVVRGVPTAEELAALVGAIVVRSRPAGAPAPAPVSTWARSGRPAGRAPGRGTWRTSGLPR